MQNVSVTRMGTLWQLWDGEIVYPYPQTCELRELIDMPAQPDLHIHYSGLGEVTYYDKGNHLCHARIHNFGGVSEDCILAPNGLWYHLNGPAIKYIDGMWYATYTGYKNDNLAHMLNAGFWAYKDYMPVRWLLKDIWRSVRRNTIKYLSALWWKVR